MSLVLTPRATRKRRVDQPLTTTEIDPELSQPEMRKTQPLESDPARRPRLVFGNDAAPAGASADFRRPADLEAEPDLPDTRPRVVDEYSNQVDKLRYLENTPAKDTNGRWRSFLLNGLEGASSAARAALQGGAKNPLAAALGGFAAGGASGAIKPSLDEERDQERDAQYTRGRIAEEAQRADVEAEIGYKRARPTLELGRINQTAADRRSREREAELNRESRENTAKIGADARAADRKSRENEGNLSRASREKVARISGSQRENKVPDTYYRGKDAERIKDMALQRAMASGEFDQTQVNPEVLAAYGGDVAKVQKAIRIGDLTPAQAFTDPKKGAQFQRALASAHETLSREAQEFDRAIDMTSKSASATRISYADFETTWEKFLNDYRSAKPENRDGIRRQFEQALSKVRLVGE